MHRLYVKCNHPGCERRRQIEVETRSGRSRETLVEEEGEHNHPPLVIEGDHNDVGELSPQQRQGSELGSRYSSHVYPERVGEEDSGGMEHRSEGYRGLKRQRESIEDYVIAADDDSSISEADHDVSTLVA